MKERSESNLKYFLFKSTTEIIKQNETSKTTKLSIEIKMSEPKKVDNYSILIVAKYLQTPEDYINLICVCKNYKKTLKKFRYNPIPVHNTNLFPLMQTQYIYYPSEKRIEDVELYNICYPVSYKEYLKYKEEGNIKCSKVMFDDEDAKSFNGTFPEVVHSIKTRAFIDIECKSLTLPTHITSLGENCFARMTDLTSMELSPHLNSLPFGILQLCFNLENIVIPFSITGIESYVFCQAKSLKSIVIPDSVSYVGNCVFKECTSLTNVVLSTSLKCIGEEMFKNCCSLTSIEIPESITILNHGAFENCTNLKSVKIPLQLKIASLNVFKNCINLTSIHLPSTCTYIGEGTISGCTSLKTIRFPTDKYGYYVYNINYDDYLLLKNSINKFRRLEWNRNETKNNEPRIAYECNYLSKECYENCNIEHVVIPINIRSIKDSCFKNCINLSSVYLSDSVTYLNDYAFENCKQLKRVKLSENITVIPINAFKNCVKLEEINIPTKVSKIQYECFCNCESLTSIHIPDDCKIAQYCFDNCKSLKELTLPNKDGLVDCEMTTREYEIIRKFGYKCKHVVYNPDDKYAEIPNLDYPFGLGRRAFEDSTKESIIIPSNVTRIYSEAFIRCFSLTSIVIPEGCLRIGKLAFKYCTKLEEITIPSTVTHFGDLFLENCLNLKKVNVPNNILLGPVQIDQAFLIESLGVKCPKICMRMDDYDQIKSIPPQVKMIGAFCFKGNKNLRSLNIPTTIEELGYESFTDCPNLTSLTIPSSVTKIGYSCFDSCHALRKIEMNAQVTKLKQYTFNCCGFTEIKLQPTIKEMYERTFATVSELVEFTIPSSVTRVGESFINCSSKLTSIKFDKNCQLEVLSDAFAFYCQKLKEIDLPTSITKMQTDAFNDCITLSRISMPNMQHIEQCSFNNCFSLSTIDLPSTLTYLGSYAFQFCYNLKEVNIPESVVRLGNSLFMNCDSLTSVTLPTTLKFEEVDHCLFKRCSGLKEIHIGKEKIKEYPFKVTYSIMLQFKTIGIKCKEVVLTNEDVYLNKQQLKKEPIPKEVKYLDDNCFRNNDDFVKIVIHKNIVSIGKECFKNCNAIIKNKSKIKLNY